MNVWPHSHHFSSQATPPTSTNAPHRYLARQTRNRVVTLGFGFLAPNPSPPLAFVNARPHGHHFSSQATPPTPPPLFSTTDPKPSRHARFRVFGSQPLSPVRVCERAAPRPPFPLTSNPTTAFFKISHFLSFLCILTFNSVITVF